MKRTDSLREVSPPGFDVSSLGTPEAAWSAVLEHAPTWAPPTGPLVVVAPHPDDETLGSGGLIASWTTRGAPVMVVSVSDGEAAEVNVPELASVRRRELDEAMSRLGVERSDVHRMGLPDGRLSEHEDEIVRRLQEWIPREATLIAPCDDDGHPDHDAVARACVRVAEACGLTLARYPIWSWLNASPDAFDGERLGRFLLSPRARAAKRRALDSFRSQLGSADVPAIVPPHVRAYFDRDYEVFLL